MQAAHTPGPEGTPVTLNLQRSGHAADGEQTQRQRCDEWLVQEQPDQRHTAVDLDSLKETSLPGWKSETAVTQVYNAALLSTRVADHWNLATHILAEETQLTSCRQLMDRAGAAVSFLCFFFFSSYPGS